MSESSIFRPVILAWYWASSGWGSRGDMPAVWPVSHWIGDGLVILAMVIWGLLTLAFISRLLRFPHSVLAEIRHPVMSSFVSLFPATTMLVAIGFVPWYRPLAIVLFSIGVVIQLAYAARQTAGLWRGEHPEEATTPGLYLPTVANNFISAMACGALGFNDAGLVFLGAGVFSGSVSSRLFCSVYEAAASCRRFYGLHLVYNWRLRWSPVARGLV